MFPFITSLNMYKPYKKECLLIPSPKKRVRLLGDAKWDAYESAEREKTLRKCGVGVIKSIIAFFPRFLRASPLLRLERVHILALPFIPADPGLEE